MTISPENIQFFLSGGSSNNNPNSSLGGAISNYLVTGLLNNIFSDVTSDEASEGKVDYRCVYVKNANSSDSLYDAFVFISSQITGGSYVEIGISGNPAPLIAVDTLAPDGVTFIETNVDNRISVGDISPLQAVPVWIKRVTPSGTSFKENDNFVLKVSGKPFA